MSKHDEDSDSRAVEVLRPGAAPQTSVTVPLNQEHLIAVVISEAETRLAARLDEATAEANNHGKEAEHTRLALRALIQEAGAPGLKAHVAAVVGPVREATGLKIDEKYTYGDARTDRHYTASVEAAGYGDGKSFNYNTAFLQPLTAEMAALFEQIEGHETLQRERTAVAADSRRRLQQIPQLERRARAKLAKVVMAQTPEGRELYDRLVAEIDGD
jgi:hypothetical protein